MGDVPYTPEHTFSTFPPFPDDVVTAPLVTLSLAKLQSAPALTNPESLALFDCAKSLGFFYLDMRGSPEGETLLDGAERLHELEKKFFDLSEEEREVSARERRNDGNGYYGWKRMGTTVMDRKGTIDRYETFNIKKDDIVGNTAPLPAPKLVNDNMRLLSTYVRTAHGIIIHLLNHLNAHLRLPPGTLAGLHRLNHESGDHVRFKRSPAQAPGTLHSGAHTDFGTLTILFNWLGGLQLQLPQDDKQWVYVRPVPGAAIVNLGDALVKFTAGLFRSNIHRVLSPPGEQCALERYSLVYFSRPEDSVLLKRLQGGIIDEQPRVEGEEEEVTNSKEWILRRGLANKADNWTPDKWDKGRGTEGDRDP
ncbi:putative 1-aminocyclopropane-1-carboxylate oxidase [Calocera cornea HHB12733]|uniref:Putative 1-aminocyclopropane-1-carboxylate oxidase n=1 Tax=Calocera cornea HHB12733 TaxID=1353952 RepID=A0A165JH87_9BASI|nr:putative 1-aminocyclopropane-1-carboxylate oxidase [Calocera cornea HHB12733]